VAEKRSARYKEREGERCVFAQASRKFWRKPWGRAGKTDENCYEIGRARNVVYGALVKGQKDLMMGRVAIDFGCGA